MTESQLAAEEADAYTSPSVRERTRVILSDPERSRFALRFG